MYENLAGRPGTEQPIALLQKNQIPNEAARDRSVTQISFSELEISVMNQGKLIEMLHDRLIPILDEGPKAQPKGGERPRMSVPLAEEICRHRDAVERNNQFLSQLIERITL